MRTSFFIFHLILLGACLTFGQSNDLSKDPVSGSKDLQLPAKSDIKDVAVFTKKSNEDLSLYDSVYIYVDNNPEFPGGEGAMFKWLGANIIYPPEAKANNSQGRVYARFIIEKDGSISNVSIIKDSVNFGTSDEVVRVIRAMPKWTPGVHNGEIVRVQYTLPFSFNL